MLCHALDGDVGKVSFNLRHRAKAILSVSDGGILCLLMSIDTEYRLVIFWSTAVRPYLLLYLQHVSVELVSGESIAVDIYLTDCSEVKNQRVSGE